MPGNPNSYYPELEATLHFDSASASRIHSNWAVPWADLMMVMFVLFVVLFVYANTQKDVMVVFGGNPGVSVDGVTNSGSRGTEGIPVMALENHEVHYKSATNGVSVVKESNNRIRVVLRGDVFFAAGQGELGPEAESYLVEVAELMEIVPGAVTIEGYVDGSEGEGVDSFDLSAKRATAVAAYFMNSTELDPKRFSVSGLGAYQPEVPDGFEDSEFRNRRVEIIIDGGVERSQQ